MSHDTWIHRLSRVAVRPLAKTPVRPNHLTTVRLIAGIGAAALMATGDPGLMGWGAGIFLLSMILDRADGELARMTGRTSAAGHRFDLFADSFSNTISFIGLGFGLRYGPLGDKAIAMGFTAGLAVSAVLFMVIRLEALAGERAGEIRGAAGFDPDDALIAIPVAIWLGYPEALLTAAAFGAPVFALGFMLVYLLRRGRHDESRPEE